MDRRSFLKTAAVTAAATSALGAISKTAFAEEKKRIPISVQLYSVRDACAKDLAKTLKEISHIGYEAVEFAGYYGKDPKDIRKMLDDNGLKCSGTHTGLGELINGKFDRTIEIHKELGTDLILVPGGIDRYLHNVVASEALAMLFNELADKANKLDMWIGYHAHGGDAKDIDGMSAWDRFFSKTHKNVVAQMDIGNYQAGGGDPYASLEKFPGQGKTVHLKANGNNNAPIGKDKVDWKRVFEICETTAGTEWYVVEHEVGSSAILTGIKECFEGLKELGKTKS